MPDYSDPALFQWLLQANLGFPSSAAQDSNPLPTKAEAEWVHRANIWMLGRHIISQPVDKWLVRTALSLGYIRPVKGRG